MVDAPRAQAGLGYFKTAPLAEQDVAHWYAYVLKQDFHMPVRRVVIAHHMQRAQHRDARRVGRHQHHALLGMAGCLRIGFPHQDVDRAARITRARDPPFAPVDHIVVPIALDAGGDVGGIAGGHIGFGHGKGGTDFTVKQRLEPAAFGVLRTKAGHGFHVAGIGRGTVENFAGPEHAPHDFGQRGVFLVAQARARETGGLRAVHRQKQIPQTGLAGQWLEPLDGLQRRPALARSGVGRNFLRDGGFGRVHMGVHEVLQTQLQGFGFIGVFEVHGGS